MRDVCKMPPALSVCHVVRSPVPRIVRRPSRTACETNDVAAASICDSRHARCTTAAHLPVARIVAADDLRGLAVTLDAIRDRKRGADVSGARIAVLRNDRRSDEIRHMLPVYRAQHLQKLQPSEQHLRDWTAAVKQADEDKKRERLFASVRADILDGLAEALADYDRRPAPDPQVAADRKALAEAYRQGKADLPHVRPFARAVQSATSAVLAAEQTAVLAATGSNGERKRVGAILRARRLDLARCVAEFHAALDHATEARIVDSRQLRDKPIGWNGRRDRPYRHVALPLFENPNAKPWQV